MVGPRLDGWMIEKREPREEEQDRGDDQSICDETATDDVN